VSAVRRLMDPLRGGAADNRLAPKVVFDEWLCRDDLQHVSQCCLQKHIQISKSAGMSL
jgi:hypothetical protein